jgi:hypothetical protein
LLTWRTVIIVVECTQFRSPPLPGCGEDGSARGRQNFSRLGSQSDSGGK